MRSSRKSPATGKGRRAPANEETPIKGFYRLTDLMAASAAPPRHYAGPAVEIEFGLFYKGGRGTAGEIFVTWEKGGADGALGPKLHAYGDAFGALWQLREVVKVLSTRPNITPDELCAQLRRRGFTDFTVSDTPWLTHEPTGSFYRIHEGVFEAAPMSADESVTEPFEEEISEVDYDSAASCGETDLAQLRAIEIALRSGATSLDDLAPYTSKGTGRAQAEASRRGLR
jgi:hypothetical protein